MFCHSVPFEGVCSGEKNHEYATLYIVSSVLRLCFTSVQQAKLAVEGSHQFAVPRCLMGADSSLEVFAPNCRATGTHQEGSQLVHT